MFLHFFHQTIGLQQNTKPIYKMYIKYDYYGKS